MSMKVLGFRRNDFHAAATERFEEGDITGMDVFFSYALEGGTGTGATRIYLTDKKLRDSGYNPNVGDEVDITYNRYGKVAGIRKVK